MTTTDTTTELQRIGAKRIAHGYMSEQLFYVRFTSKSGLRHTLYGTSQADLHKRVCKWCKKWHVGMEPVG